MPAENAILFDHEPGIDAARHLAERLLARMPPAAGIDTRAPASVGVATFDAADDSSDTLEALVHRADAALYNTKAKGRHQVRVA